MTKQVHILLGGLTTWGDGYLTSGGMYGLADQLRKLPEISVTVWQWAQWIECMRAIKPGKVAIIGYSGGGSRATWLANAYKKDIDLMVLYDPSPNWQMEPVYANVKQVVCYQNDTPMMPVPTWRPPFVMFLGGGVVEAHTNSSVFHIAEQHLAVQYDQVLHKRTIEFVENYLK